MPCFKDSGAHVEVGRAEPHRYFRRSKLQHQRFAHARLDDRRNEHELFRDDFDIPLARCVPRDRCAFGLRAGAGNANISDFAE